LCYGGEVRIPVLGELLIAHVMPVDGVGEIELAGVTRSQCVTAFILVLADGDDLGRVVLQAEEARGEVPRGGDYAVAAGGPEIGLRWGGVIPEMFIAGCELHAGGECF
jgi:hypothetical protein